MICLVKKYWTMFCVGTVVLWVRVLLRAKSLPFVLERLHTHAGTRQPDEARMDDLAYYVDRWLQVFPYNARGNCFPRSLSLYWFARRMGYPVCFHCGVRKEGSNLDGHAWLTLDREPFHELGQHWQSFTVTFSYPPDLASGWSQGHVAGRQPSRTAPS
jgi:hypothetical protein